MNSLIVLKKLYYYLNFLIFHVVQFNSFFRVITGISKSVFLQQTAENLVSGQNHDKDEKCSKEKTVVWG